MLLLLLIHRIPEMSKRTQAVKVTDPECFQKLPPHCVLALDGDTATTLSESGDKFINFVETSGHGGTIFSVVPFAEAGSYPATPVAGTNTGDGTMSAITCSLTTVTEDWTITCTDDTTEGAEEWSVTGTVSGAQAAVATTGVEYTSDSGEVVFTITAGGVAFAADDEFTFTTTHRSSYVLAKVDCRLIFEGLIVRTDDTEVGGVALLVGDVDGNYGNTSYDFITSIPAAVGVGHPPISSTITLAAGEGVSFRYNGLGDPTFVGVQLSSVFPE